MIKYAALSLVAVLVACSAEVENGQSAEAVETLSVNNLVITDANNVGSNIADGEPATPVQRAETPPSAPEAAATRPSQRQGETRSQAEARAEPAPKPPAKPPAEAERAKVPDPTCTPEHRELGHC